jgi:hypothetical protein
MEETMKQSALPVAGNVPDYGAQLAELVRLLALEPPPRWADFSYAEVQIAREGVQITDLASDPGEQEELRALARDDDTLEFDEENDSLLLVGRELASEVFAPFEALSPTERACYRLISVLAMHPPLGEAFACLDEWVHLDDGRLAAAYWECAGARHGAFENDVLAKENGKLIEWLIRHRVDLSRWASPYGVDTYLELPRTPALAWVGQQRLCTALFGLSEEEARSDELDENGLARLLAYTLHALRVVSGCSEELTGLQEIKDAVAAEGAARRGIAIYALLPDGTTTSVGQIRVRGGNLEVLPGPGKPWAAAEHVWRVRVSEGDFPSPHLVGAEEEERE